MRAGEGRWEPVCAGIERKTLWHDREKGRITFLIRAQPGAEFPAHQHDDDEEAYVLSGDLSFDDLVLGAGDYHLARPGVRHPVGRTKARLHAADDRGGVSRVICPVRSAPRAGGPRDRSWTAPRA